MEHESYDFGEAIRYLATIIWHPARRDQSDAESLLAEKEREKPPTRSWILPGPFLKISFTNEEGQLQA
jgi:hypothetical protein